MNCFYLLGLVIALFSCDLSASIKNYSDQERELIIQLYDIGVLRFNTESMNTPLSSPYYIDLRHTISHPQIFKQIINFLKKRSEQLSYDIICGVPYAALAMAANVAYDLEKPLIMRRAHAKKHGTAKKIEGSFSSDMQCLIFEDVVTTATSLIETIQDLEFENLLVKDCIVLFDREQGGVAWMEEQGYKVHVIFSITDFMTVLSDAGKVDKQLAHTVLEWTKTHQAGGYNWKAALEL